MKPIVVRNSIVPKLVSWFFPVAAITLWPFIFIRPKHDTERLINHECIHIRQYNECLVLGFIVIYLWDWFVGLIKYKDPKKAYLQIRVEQEARAWDTDSSYLDSRQKFAWRVFKV